MADFRYRHFIYLDSDEILKIAAIMEGGEVDEEVHTLTKGFGANIGAKFGFAALGASLGLQGNRRFTKEWKLRRTAYVAADKVLSKLAPKETAATEVSSIPENRVIQCDIDLHPLLSRYNEDKPHMDVKQLIRPWWQKLFTSDPTIEARAQNVDRYGTRQPMQVSMLGSKGSELTETKLLLVLEPRWVLNPGEFSRRATIIGQVIAVKRQGEELVRTRDSYGPLFEFRSQSAAASAPKPIQKHISLGEIEPGIAQSNDSEKNQQSTVASLPNVLLEGNRSQAGEQYPDVPKSDKGRRGIFQRKHQKTRADVEAAADIDLERNPDEGDEEFWHTSVVLRPIVIFK